MADTLFDELKDALKDFKDFLDANVGTISSLAGDPRIMQVSVRLAF